MCKGMDGMKPTRLKNIAKFATTLNLMLAFHAFLHSLILALKVRQSRSKKCSAQIRGTI